MEGTLSTIACGAAVSETTCVRATSPGHDSLTVLRDGATHLRFHPYNKLQMWTVRLSTCHTCPESSGLFLGHGLGKPFTRAGFKKQGGKIETDWNYGATCSSRTRVVQNRLHWRGLGDFTPSPNVPAKNDWAYG